jgi:hypothetical protein
MVAKTIQRNRDCDLRLAEFCATLNNQTETRCRHKNVYPWEGPDIIPDGCADAGTDSPFKLTRVLMHTIGRAFIAQVVFIR